MEKVTDIRQGVEKLLIETENTVSAANARPAGDAILINDIK